MAKTAIVRPAARPTEMTVMADDSACWRMLRRTSAIRPNPITSSPRQRRGVRGGRPVQRAKIFDTAEYGERGGIVAHQQQRRLAFAAHFADQRERLGRMPLIEVAGG